MTEAYFRNFVGSVPDHCNKVNIKIKQFTHFFWFPSASKSYIYTTLLSIKCVILIDISKSNLHT